MRYLVTGGRGVIASLFARRLVREGHQVTIVDDGDDPRHLANSFEGPSYHAERLERMSLDRLTGLVASSDRVFHAAASTGIPYSAEQPLDDWRRNVDGTLALLEALRREPRPTVVLSSVKPYDLDNPPVRLASGGYCAESTPIGPLRRLNNVEVAGKGPSTARSTSSKPLPIGPPT